MGAWYFKQPNGNYGRFSTCADTVTHYNFTKSELKQDMIDRFGKYDEDVRDFDNFVNETGRYKDKNAPFYLHDFSDVLSDMTSSNETTGSAQGLLISMGLPVEEAMKYYFMDFPDDAADNDPIWDTYEPTLQKKE